MKKITGEGMLFSHKNALHHLNMQRDGEGITYCTYDFDPDNFIHGLDQYIYHDVDNAMNDMKHLLDRIYPWIKEEPIFKPYNMNRIAYTIDPEEGDYFCIGKIDLYKIFKFPGADKGKCKARMTFNLVSPINDPWAPEVVIIRIHVNDLYNTDLYVTFNVSTTFAMSGITIDQLYGNLIKEMSDTFTDLVEDWAWTYNKGISKEAIERLLSRSHHSFYVAPVEWGSIQITKEETK